MSNNLGGEDEQLTINRPSKKRRFEEISNESSENHAVDQLMKSNKKKKQDNPTKLELTPNGKHKDNQMVDIKAIAQLPIKSPGTLDATSKPTSANVKSFAALKMKSKLEKSGVSALNAEQS